MHIKKMLFAFTAQVFRMSDDETRRRLLRYFELVGICNQINDNNAVKKNNINVSMIL